jgi:hypothetical protein
MVEGSIEVHSGTARLAVSVPAKSIRRAMSLVAALAALYPASVATRVKLPIDQGGFSSRIVLLLERGLSSLLLRSPRRTL